jgi:uncharacterized protein
LDTNFLMIPTQFKVDIFTEIRRLMDEPYGLFVYDASIAELSELAKGNSRDAGHAKAAITLIKQKNLKTLPNSVNEKYVDDLILKGVTEGDVVCTQDQALKRLLRGKYSGIRFITLKSKKYLGFS